MTTTSHTDPHKHTTDPAWSSAYRDLKRATGATYSEPDVVDGNLADILKMLASSLNRIEIGVEQLNERVSRIEEAIIDGEVIENPYVDIKRYDVSKDVLRETLATSKTSIPEILSLY